jgi:hypothetical protein
MTRPSLRAAALLLTAAVIEGCGGDVAAPKSPGSFEDLSTPESALQALARAEGLLDRSLGPTAVARGDQPRGLVIQQVSPPPPPAAAAASTPAPPASAGHGYAAPPEPVAPAERPSQPYGGGAREEKPRERSAVPAQASDPCLTACSALASMERAAEHLCGLAGAEDARCTGARARVQSASARVHAACPACRG